MVGMVYNNMVYWRFIASFIVNSFKRFEMFFFLLFDESVHVIEIDHVNSIELI